MFSYSCKKCQSNMTLDNSGSYLVCKGCGEKIVDISMIDIEEYDRSAICPKCGGSMNSHSSGNMMTCPYCNSTFFINDFFYDNDFKYHYIIPFKNNSREEILEQFYLICDEQFAPKDFRTAAHINSVKNIFLPFYLFETHCKVHYTLEVGHTETRRKYNSVKEKYEDVSETVWEHRNGNFSDTYFITTRAFSDSSQSIGSQITSDRIKNNTLMAFEKAVLAQNISADKYELYSPIKLNSSEVLPSISETEAWKEEGGQFLDKRIELHISTLYSGPVRNIRFTSDTKFKGLYIELFPASFVCYDYKKLKDKMLVFDGIDGQIHKGAVPLSKEKLLLSIAGIYIPMGLLVTGIIIPQLKEYKCYNNRIFISVFMIALAIIIMVWLLGLKGTGGNRESAAAKKNRSRSLVCGTLAAITSLIAGFFLVTGYDSSCSGDLYSSKYDRDNKVQHTVTAAQHAESTTAAKGNYSMDVGRFCHIMNGVWIDAYSVVDYGFDIDFFFCYFKNTEICFGQYCGHVEQTGTIEKVEYDDYGNYSITVHYPLVDNEAEYYEERYDTIKMVMYQDYVVFEDGEFYRWGTDFEEATAALKEVVDRKKGEIDTTTVFSEDEAIVFTGITEYDRMINEYRTAMSIGDDKLYELYPDDSAINTLMVHYYYCNYGAILYTVYDIDNNGIPELLFSNGYSLIDVYTLQEDKLVKLFKDCNFGERTCLEITADGSMIVSGSNSAFEQYMERYSMNETGDELICLEKYYFNENGEDPYMSGFTYLSEDDFHKKMNSFDCEIMYKLTWNEII